MNTIVTRIICVMILAYSPINAQEILQKKQLSKKHIGLMVGAAAFGGVTIVAKQKIYKMLYRYYFERGLTKGQLSRLEPKGNVIIGIQKNGKGIRFRQLHGKRHLILHQSTDDRGNITILKAPEIRFDGLIYKTLKANYSLAFLERAASSDTGFFQTPFDGILEHTLEYLERAFKAEDEKKEELSNLKRVIIATDTVKERTHWNNDKWGRPEAFKDVEVILAPYSQALGEFNHPQGYPQVFVFIKSQDSVKLDLLKNNVQAATRVLQISQAVVVGLTALGIKQIHQRAVYPKPDEPTAFSLAQIADFGAAEDLHVAIFDNGKEIECSKGYQQFPKIKYKSLTADFSIAIFDRMPRGSSPFFKTPFDGVLEHTLTYLDAAFEVEQGKKDAQRTLKRIIIATDRVDEPTPWNTEKWGKPSSFAPDVEVMLYPYFEALEQFKYSKKYPQIFVFIKSQK